MWFNSKKTIAKATQTTHGNKPLTRVLLITAAIACIAVFTDCVVIGDHLDQFRKRFYTYPIWVFDNARGYRENQPPAKLMNDDTNVVVAISGGGARASYFSACVLEQLAAQPDPTGKGKSLLDRVQVVSGVSGGSLAAMYYGLYKPANLNDSNRGKFFSLFKNHMSINQVMSGVSHFENNIWEFGLYYYTRWRVSQTLAQMYDRKVFRRATLGHLHSRALRGEAPLVVVNATNLDTGGKFLFTALPTAKYFNTDPAALSNAPALKTLATAMNTSVNKAAGFDTIDSEADNFRASVAVAASSGLPFTPGPTTLVNYATNGYVHLADGGINDNTGIDSLVQLYINAKARGKRGKLVIICIDAMQGNVVARSNDKDPDGYVGSLQYAAHAFGTASARTQIYQNALVDSASPYIKTIHLRLNDNKDANLQFNGRGPGGVGIFITREDAGYIERAAADLVAKNLSKLNRAIAN